MRKLRSKMAFPILASLIEMTALFFIVNFFCVNGTSVRSGSSASTRLDSTHKHEKSPSLALSDQLIVLLLFDVPIMSRKSTATATSKHAAPSATSSSSTQKSSILRSSFAPSRFQLRLFASVVQSFEFQQLRIHDTSTSRLRCVHAAKPNAKINCLDWGIYSKSKPKGRRPSKQDSHHANEDIVIAYGTSDSEVCIFSPAEGKLVGNLTGAHERGIYDFKFSPERTDEAWSIGGDSALIQWDLKSNRPVRTISLSDPATRTLSDPSITPPTLLCASTTPFSIDLEDAEQPHFETFDSMKNLIHTLYRSGTNGTSATEYFLAADNDRYVNIYDLTAKRLVRTLIAGAGVQHADFLDTKSDGVDAWNSQMLSLVTNDGVVELFFRPFVPPTNRNGDVKSKRKGLTQKANAKVKLVNAGDSKGHAAIASASLQGPELLVATVDGGVDVSFQKIRWQDEGTGELLFDGIKEVPRVRTASSLNSATTNGVKDVSKSHVDDSRTVVVNGIGDTEGQDVSQSTAIEISSSEDEDADDDEANSPASEVKAESDNESDEEMEDAHEQLPESLAQVGAANDDAEPSFGEVVASRHHQPIDIADAFEPESSAPAKVESGQLSLPTGMSLGTVLTQSLRTNDRNLLEACLHTTDLDVVRNTIQRLDSSLAGILLSKLAQRISSRPGRYGNLQTWVQQLCIAHGAAISTQPAVKKQVQVLYRVLDQRAKSLSHLMLLKGKLDMLDAQLKFRKQLAAQRAVRQDRGGEPGMIYIEGEADYWDSEDDHDEAAGSSVKQLRAKAEKRLENLGDEEDSTDEDMPLANGVSGSDSDEGDEEEDDVHLRSGTLVDDEAMDEDDEDSEGQDAISDEDEEDDEEDEDSDEEEQDSEMDGFINDDSIAEVDDAALDANAVEDDDATPHKPPMKKSKHR